MKLLVKNFRSIQDQELELAPITVVYGPNGTGKSTLLYALLTLRNIVLNPNQQVPGFFDYQFTSLGGFQEVVFDHDTSDVLTLGIALEHESFKLVYRVGFMEIAGFFSLSFSGPGWAGGSLSLPIFFPYQANQQTEQTLTRDQQEFTITWNGITATAMVAKGTKPSLVTQDLEAIINTPVERLRSVSFVHLRRGFTKLLYTHPPTRSEPEDEMATLLASDGYLASQVSHYLEDILGRDFRVQVRPGTALFSLVCTDRRTGMGAELVNEGFGVNQLVYLLARALHKESALVCVEEPEIHLHPTALRSLARAMVKMVREEGKGFLISTHSEPFVLALLALVAGGELQPSELAWYLATKEKKVTSFQRQQVNEKGQVEGGLMSFMEGELADIKTFLGLG